MPKVTEGTADDVMGGAQGVQAEPKAQGDGRAAAEGKAKAPGGQEEDAVVKAYREERDTRQAVTDAGKKLYHEEQGLAGMGTGLESLMAQLKEKMDKMATRKGVIQKLQEEQAEAETLLEKRKTDRLAAVAKRSAAQTNRLVDASILLGESSNVLAGSATTAPAAPEVVVEAAKPVVSAWAPVPIGTPEAVTTVATEIGEPNDKMDGDDDADSESDAETIADTAVDTYDEWREHMAKWVFFAAHGEPAPEALVRFFCGVGDDAAATAATLGKVVDEIRDKCWAERLGEASDMAAIQAVQDAGDMAKAYEMRKAQGMYAADRFTKLQAELLSKLDAGLEKLRTERTGKVKSGKFVAAANIKIAAKKGGARKVKGSKNKAEKKAAAQVIAVRDAKQKAAEELKKGVEAASSTN